jgi:rubrerythrin
MDSKTFVQQLLQENQAILDRLQNRDTLEADVGKNLDIADLLKAALKNEMEAFEIAAFWLPSTPEPDVKVALARQAGDEAKHYRLIQDRLRALGIGTEEFNPVSVGYSPLFQYLTTLDTTIERSAAGQFTREHIAVVKNRQFIDFCREIGDQETLRLYDETIAPDEYFHHQLGIQILEKYATTSELQERAEAAARRTLELADEMQQVAVRRLGTRRGPGC